MTRIENLYDAADQLKVEGKFDEAIVKLLEVLAKDGTYALAHSALAVLFGRVGKHDEAIRHAQRVCELEPSDPFSFTAMSVTYQRAYAGTNQPEYIQLAEDAMAKARIIQDG